MRCVPHLISSYKVLIRGLGGSPGVGPGGPGGGLGGCKGDSYKELLIRISL